MNPKLRRGLMVTLASACVWLAALAIFLTSGLDGDTLIAAAPGLATASVLNAISTGGMFLTLWKDRKNDEDT